MRTDTLVSRRLATRRHQTPPGNAATSDAAWQRGDIRRRLATRRHQTPPGNAATSVAAWIVNARQPGPAVTVAVTVVIAPLITIAVSSPLAALSPAASA